MSIQCRTCAEKIFNPSAKNLFEEDDNEILLNIETLTGIRLTEDHLLPKYICTCCHLDLYHAMAFRERCIRTDNYLQSAKLTGTTAMLTLDPLVMPQTIDLLKIEIKEQPDYVDDYEFEKTNTENTEILSQDSTSQRRTLRTHTQNPPVDKKIIKKRQKLSHATSRLKSPPVVKECAPDPDPKDIVQRRTRSLKTSPRSKQHKPATKLTKKRTRDKTLEFPESTPENSFPAEASSETNCDLKPNAIEEQEAVPDLSDNPTANISSKKVRNIAKPTGDPKVFICDLCGHQSCNNKNLEIHILRHKGEKNFECEECGTKHYSKYLLKLHIRVKHQGEMPFECRYCGQRFYSATSRGRHEQVRHIRNFSYECKVCGKKYLTKSCLNKHEFLHTGLRPYRCDLCNVAFPRNPGLKIHFRTKQHQKRASEALNNQLHVINEITVPDETIEFPDSIIEELDV